MTLIKSLKGRWYTYKSSRFGSRLRRWREAQLEAAEIVQWAHLRYSWTRGVFAAQKWTDFSGSSTTDRINSATINGARQLSDGTLVFLESDQANVYLKYSSDHSTINQIAQLSSSDFTLSNKPFTLCIDSLDNIYVCGTTSNNNISAKAWTKGAGYTWTAQTSLHDANNYAMNSNGSISATWCNTTGGTSNKGHILFAFHRGNATGLHYAIFDAGALLAGSGTLETAEALNPTFYGGGATSPGLVVDIEPDGFGGTEGIIVAGYNGTSHFLSIGHWGISSTGTLNVNTNLTTSLSYSTSSIQKVRVLNYASNAFAIVFPSTTSAGRYMIARYSKTAQLTAGTDSGAPTNMPLNGNGLGWDAGIDPTASNQVWVWAIGAISSGNQQMYRLSAAVGSGVTWATSVTTDDLLTGLNATQQSVRTVKQVRGSGSTLDWQCFVQTGASTYMTYGDYTTFATAPNAPTLTAPANGVYQDVGSGVTFSATYNSTDGANQNAYALRQKVGAGSYSYWNGSTWQGTIFWNAISTSPGAGFSVAVTGLSNGNTYNWSIASQESIASLQGPFASDWVLNAQALPVVVVTAPTGTVVISQPTASWTTTPGGGAVQTNYQVIVEHGAYGTIPGSGTQDWNSGVLSGAAQSLQIGAALANTLTYRVFVQATETGGELSAWAYSTFTVSFDAPSTPSLSGSYDAVNNRDVLILSALDNLLTFNQASLENANTTGWTAQTNCAIATTTAQALDGANSLQMTSSAAGDMVASTLTGTSGVAVLPSTQYIAMAYFRSIVSARSVAVAISWYTAAGALISTTYGTSVADSTSGFTQATYSAVSPSNAAFAAVFAKVIGTGAASEVHDVDEIGIMPGTSTTWYRGGLVGGQIFVLYYSDDSGVTWQYVRGANAATPAASSQQITLYDYEATPRLARQYRFFVITSGLISAPSNVVSLIPTPLDFWLKDVQDASGNMVLKIDPPLPHSRQEKQTTFMPLGATRPVVVADTLLGHASSGLKVHAQSLTEWLALQNLLNLQRPLLLQSPFGEQWYIRVGSGGHRSYELHGPDASDPVNQYRQVTIPYMEVAMPALP